MAQVKNIMIRARAALVQSLAKGFQQRKGGTLGYWFRRWHRKVCWGMMGVKLKRRLRHSLKTFPSSIGVATTRA